MWKFSLQLLLAKYKNIENNSLDLVWYIHLDLRNLDKEKWTWSIRFACLASHHRSGSSPICSSVSNFFILCCIGLLYCTYKQVLLVLHECSAPFVVFNFLLNSTGYGKTVWYVVNSVAMFIGFFIFHVVVNTYYFVHLYQHFGEVRELPSNKPFAY